MRQAGGPGRKLESADATTISTVGPIIYASTTTGVAQTTGILNRFALVTTGTQDFHITLNGLVQGSAFNVASLTYHNNTVFQKNLSNQWYYWSTSTAAYIGWTLTNISVNSTTYAANAPAGTVIGTIAVTISDGSSFNLATGVLSLGGTNAASFAIVGNQLQAAVTLSAASYSITITATPNVVGQPLTSGAIGLTQTVLNSISSVTLSSSTFVGGSADATVVGAITVVMNTGSFSGGTLSLSGTNASNFQLSSTTLPSNLETRGVDAAGNYSINIIPTLAGATGSGTAFPQTITGSSSSVIPYTLTAPTSLAVTTGAVSPLGWTVDFFDDFNGTVTSSNAWGANAGFTTGAQYQGVNMEYGLDNRTFGGYGPYTVPLSQISISGGNLNCSATTGSTPQAGVVIMNMNTCWGLWEAKMRLATGQNNVFDSNIWLSGSQWPTAGEWDIIESGGNGGPGYVGHIHINTVQSDGPTNNPFSVSIPGGGIYDGTFHVWQALLTPAYMALYIDGSRQFLSTSSTFLNNLTTATNPPHATAAGSFGWQCPYVTTPGFNGNPSYSWIIGLATKGTSSIAGTTSYDYIRHSLLNPATGGPHL